MRIILLFLFSACLCNSIYSQRYSLLNYSTANGLPQSQVTCLTQDADGYLWIGTLGGLARFNGKDFQTYSTENGLLNNRIKTIGFMDGVLWIGHEGGISSLKHRKIKKWRLPKEFKTTNVSDIIQFKNHILIASNGGGLFELKNNKLLNIPLSNTEDLRIRDLAVYKNKLWIGTRGGILTTSDLKKFTRIKNTENYSVSSIQLKGNALYISTFANGLLKMQMDNQKIKSIHSIDSLQTLKTSLMDSKGNLWISSSDGVYRINKDIITLKLNRTNGLPMENMRSIFEDREGNIWMGSEGKGLLRFPGEKFLYYNEETGLNSDLILSANQDSKGDYWLGSYDKGLMKMSKNKKLTPILIKNNNTIWASLLEVDGYNWFGTGFGLVALENTQVARVFYAEDNLPGDYITALHKISNSSFYVGGSDGVSLYRNGKFTLMKNQDIGTVRDFCSIGKTIFCATDKGLYKINGSKIENTNLINKTIYSLATDYDNCLWIGTEEGLFRWHNTILEQVPFSSFPSSNFINFINFHAGKLFVGTNNGLFILSNLKEQKPLVTNYGLADGLVNLETNINSSFIDNKGKLWFGTASGLVSYATSTAANKYSSPLLILKNILINYQKIDFLKYADGIDVHGLPKNLHLPYSKNNLTFETEGISLANYPGLQFQFWLEGQDITWSPMHANTTITFNGLSAGNYILHGRSIDSRGAVSEQFSFPFTVKQPFYSTWWFILSMVVLFAFSLYQILLFRLKREREKNEKENMNYRARLLSLEQKSLNASMNRHFIFNSLNSIQFFINTQDRLSANKFLTNFAKLIRKNLDSSEDGNEVALSQELERLDLYLSLESMRFKDRFTYSISTAADIDAELLIIPAMMLQPFIENSIIHGILPDESKKGTIEIRISLQGDILNIEIEDNGIGIDVSISSKIDYEGDHRSQGMEITTKRIELLQKISKRHFELVGPTQLFHLDKSARGTRVVLKFSVDNLDN